MFNFVRQENCRICGSTEKSPFQTISQFKEKRFVWHDLKFEYVICRECGFVYMDPVPSAESYQHFYRDYYWYVQTSAMTGSTQNGTLNKSAVPEGESRSAARLRTCRIPRVETLLSRALPRMDEGTRILEIGCGWGTTLAHLHDRYGARVFAIEPSEQARTYMRREFPFIEIIGQTAEDLYSDTRHDGQIDAIMFSHCLEMIIDQNSILSSVHRVLAAGGVVYIDTPNLFWQRALNPCHPYIYSRDTLSQFLVKHRFSIEQVRCCAPPTATLAGSLWRFMRTKDPYLTVVARKSGPAEQPSDGVREVEPSEVLSRWRIGQRALELADVPARMSYHAVRRPLSKLKRLVLN